MLIGGNIEYHGNNEPAVFEGEVQIGQVILRGAASGIGFQDCGDISIDSIICEQDDNGETPNFLFRIRATSSSVGNVRIGHISGTLRGSSLFAMSQGSAKHLHIAGGDLRFIYDAAVATNLTSWMDISSCDSLNIRDLYVTVIDEDDVTTSSSLFTMTLKSTLGKRSFFIDNAFSFFESDGATISDARFRGLNCAQDILETRGVIWRNGIGPYIEDITGSFEADGSDVVPTAGTWKRGKILYDVTPSASGSIGWVCVTAGTPGTWKTFGAISA
jgi:hypothetical protein